MPGLLNPTMAFCPPSSLHAGTSVTHFGEGGMEASLGSSDCGILRSPEAVPRDAGVELGWQRKRTAWSWGPGRDVPAPNPPSPSSNKH